MSETAKTTTVPCFICKEAVPNAMDDFCYGCKHVICGKCDETEIAGHGHLPAAHKRSEK